MTEVNTGHALREQLYSEVDRMAAAYREAHQKLANPTTEANLTRAAAAFKAASAAMIAWERFCAWDTAHDVLADLIRRNPELAQDLPAASAALSELLDQDRARYVDVFHAKSDPTTCPDTLTRLARAQLCAGARIQAIDSIRKFLDGQVAA